MHIPGLKVVSPSTAGDAKGLIKAAVRCNDPVIFLEHKLMYAKKFDVPDDEEYIIPLGKADVKREGRDVTILTWSREVLWSLEAAEELEKQGISAEIIDLRTLVPLDWDTVANSVCKTHHVMVVEEGVRRAGVGSELAAPVARVAGANVVSPFAPPLEDAVFPHAADIAAGAHRLLNR